MAATEHKDFKGLWALRMRSFAFSSSLKAR